MRNNVNCQMFDKINEIGILSVFFHELLCSKICLKENIRSAFPFINPACSLLRNETEAILVRMTMLRTLLLTDNSIIRLHLFVLATSLVALHSDQPFSYLVLFLPAKWFADISKRLRCYHFLSFQQFCMTLVDPRVFPVL